MVSFTRLRFYIKVRITGGNSALKRWIYFMESTPQSFTTSFKVINLHCFVAVIDPNPIFRLNRTQSYEITPL